MKFYQLEAVEKLPQGPARVETEGDWTQKAHRDWLVRRADQKPGT